MSRRRVFGSWDPYLAPPFVDDPLDPGNDPRWDGDDLPRDEDDR